MADQPTAPVEAIEGGESEQERRRGEVLAAYFAAVEAGRGPTPQELIAQHPDLAHELAGYFADQERFGRLVAPLRPAAQGAPAEAATLAGGEPTATSRARGPAPASTLT